MTERLHFHFLLSCTGGGNGNPLQYSCLKNPRDKGAWWAAVYGVAQSRTRLTWLSSSRPLNPLYGSQFYCGETACVTQFTMSHATQGHPTRAGHSEEFWQNAVHRRMTWQPTPVFLPWEPHEQNEKTKSYDTRRWALMSEGVQYATGEE